jgi:hypothetical protein
MKSRRLHAALLATALAVTSSTLISGCDWVQFAFMNSIPFKGDPSKNPVVRVYLGVDGVSVYSMRDAIARGAFQDPAWSLSTSIAPFPVTSDANWTRILRAPDIDGHELEYYDPISDQIRNRGLMGLARHVLPVPSESLDLGAPFYKGFDYRADGYLHGFAAYSDAHLSIAASLDNLFYTLEGRAETASVFTAYLLELDVLGHLHTRAGVADALLNLSRRIERFKRRHPERQFHFTLFSDHGMDFMPAPRSNLVVIRDELPKVGVTPVTSLRGKDPRQGPYAVPVMHTRVSYVSLHTESSLVPEVAGRVSRIKSVDLTVGRLPSPPSDPGLARQLEWFGIWAEGQLALYYGFDAQSDEYYLPAGQNYERLDIASLAPASGFRVIGDDDLFAAVRKGRYPDLFYRIRTGLSPIGVRFPADVLVSFREHYVSKGFSLPGGEDIANEGFHGALSEYGSSGALLTTERVLPEVIRAETILDLFPHLQRHLNDTRGLQLGTADAGLGLDYSLSTDSSRR